MQKKKKIGFQTIDSVMAIPKQDCQYSIYQKLKKIFGKSNGFHLEVTNSESNICFESKLKCSNTVNPISFTDESGEGFGVYNRLFQKKTNRRGETMALPLEF